MQATITDTPTNILTGLPAGPYSFLVESGSVRFARSEADAATGLGPFGPGTVGGKGYEFTGRLRGNATAEQVGDGFLWAVAPPGTSAVVSFISVA